jgi:CubicO group peptidase (beta-lactamase class C family)
VTLGGPAYLLRALLYLLRGRSLGASDEHRLFDAVELPASNRPVLLTRSGRPLPPVWTQRLIETKTRAFRVFRDGQLTAWDAPGDAPERAGRLYSVTKSVLSLAWGAADAEGLVPGLDEPVYRELTVRALLRMDSGLGFDEGLGGLNRQVLTYLHPNARATAFRARLDDHVGKDFHYNDFHSLLLGVLLEQGLTRAAWTPRSAIAEPVAAWVWERVLEPMGMAHPGRFVVDSHRRRFPKTESGLVLAADDVVRLGLLVLNRGRANDIQVVPEAWLAASTNPANGWSGAASFTRYRGLSWGPWLATGRGFYGWHWWGRFEKAAVPTVFALGIHGQLLVISPRHRAVVVRLADRWALKEWWPDVILEGLDSGEL